MRRLQGSGCTKSLEALRRALACAAAVALLAAGCGTSGPAAVGPTRGDCGAGCARSCDERCATTVAQCESRCDTIASLDLGNTEKQATASRGTDASCRRSCDSEAQTCQRTCKAECEPCDSPQ